MLLIFAPLSLFAVSLIIRPARNLYMNYINSIGNIFTNTYKSIKLLINGCISGDVTVGKCTGLIKDYTLHRARSISSNHLNLGKLEYNPKSKLYNLTYYKSGSEYNILFKKGIGGPRSIRACYDEYNKNIMSELISALGISKDFHQIPTTPGMLGYSSLRIVYNTGIERIFQKSEIISLRSPESV